MQKSGLLSYGDANQIVFEMNGGPIAEPDDTQYVISKIQEIDVFFGASSIERFAAERCIKAQTEAFGLKKGSDPSPG